MDTATTTTDPSPDDNDDFQCRQKWTTLKRTTSNAFDESADEIQFLTPRKTIKTEIPMPTWATDSSPLVTDTTDEPQSSDSTPEIPRKQRPTKTEPSDLSASQFVVVKDIYQVHNTAIMFHPLCEVKTFPMPPSPHPLRKPLHPPPRKPNWLDNKIMVDKLILSCSDSSSKAKRIAARDLDKCLHVRRVIDMQDSEEERARAQGGIDVIDLSIAEGICAPNDSDIDYDDTIAYQNNTVKLKGQS